MSNQTQSLFVEEIRKYSRNIDEYLAAQRYLTEVEDPDDATPEVVFNLVIGMVVDELGQLGLTLPVRDVYTDVDMINLMLHLRSRFDIEEFSNVLRDSDSLAEDLTTLLSSDDYVIESLPGEVIDTIRVQYPLSSIWEFLHIHRDVIEGSVLFQDHIEGLLKLSFDDVKSDVDDAIVIAYTKVVETHQKRVRTYIEDIVDNLELDEKDSTGLLNVMDPGYHDSDLPGKVPKTSMAMYLDPLDPHPAYAPRGYEDEAVLAHKESSWHHVEYYAMSERRKELLQTLSPTTLPHLIAIVADLYRPQWSVEDNVNQMRETITKVVQLPTEVMEFLEKCIAIMSRRVVS